MLVVITGASSGVGLACVQRFISAGYSLRRELGTS